MLASIDFSSIRHGHVVVVPDWLERPLVEALREEISAIDAAGKEFFASGVATGGQDGEYGVEDRRVCVLSRRRRAGSVRATVDERIDQLCREIGSALDRPTLRCAGERYYSVSRPGSRLALHMDERHEDTKGGRAWSTRTRRSVSWLLYLSSSGCQGGHLRTYCRRASPMATCGAHEGNLQVGWLDGASDAAYDEPVFLDSWVKEAAPSPSTDGEEPDAGELWRPRSALYRLRAEGGGERDYLSDAFGAGDASWEQALAAASCTAADVEAEDDYDDGGDDDGDGDGVTPAEFAAALRAMLPAEAAFSGLEEVCHPRIDAAEVAPAGGTLVLFDSVCVPHEVLRTARGGEDRLALAGWLHEAQQEAPDWFG